MVLHCIFIIGLIWVPLTPRVGPFNFKAMKYLPILFTLLLIACDTTSADEHPSFGVPQAYAALDNFNFVEIEDAIRFEKSDVAESDEWLLNPESLVRVSVSDTASEAGSSYLLFAAFNLDEPDEAEMFSRLNSAVGWQNLHLRSGIEIPQETLRTRWRSDNVFLFTAADTDVEKLAIEVFKR